MKCIKSGRIPPVGVAEEVKPFGASRVPRTAPCSKNFRQKSREIWIRSRHIRVVSKLVYTIDPCTGRRTGRHGKERKKERANDCGTNPRIDPICIFEINRAALTPAVAFSFRARERILLYHPVATLLFELVAQSRCMPVPPSFLPSFGECGPGVKT